MNYKKISISLIVILISIIVYLIWLLSSVQERDRRLHQDEMSDMIIEASVCDLALDLNTMKIDGIRDEVSAIQDLSKASLKFTGPLITATSEDEVSSLTFSLMERVQDIMFKIDKIKTTIDDIPSESDMVSPE